MLPADTTLPAPPKREPVAADGAPAFAPIDPAHFVVERQLAQGGMGRVLLARDHRLGRPVAIKELLTRDDDLKRRFEREVRITARLQHPSIVSVYEAGTWPNGDPFLAMKLVSGRPLDQVIEATSTLEERIALLPAIIALTDALAYAHGERVIHRDLKPSNVLIGDFGETVVIDWGLAKDLGERDEPGADRSPPLPASGAQTVEGAVLGTPAYMPPEQARGQSVDARADVYSLGAILYHALARQPPYEASSVRDLLIKVVEGPPTSLEARVPEVPADLGTIVRKAMARDPAERYPTAKELSADLKRFQTGQLVGSHRYSPGQLVRRWVARHRATVLVSLGFMVLLAATGLFGLERTLDERRVAEEQRRVADEQRQVAQRNRSEAEGLMEFMVFDLAAKLQTLGKLKFLTDVADRVGAYYSARAADGVSDAERAGQAGALKIVGDVLKAKGDIAGAVARYREALAMFEALVSREPGNVSYVHHVIDTAHMLGLALLDSGRTDEALDVHRKGLVLAERQFQQAPADSSLQKLALGHADVGRALERQKNLTGAVTEYEATVALTTRLVEHDPVNAEWPHDLAVAHSLLGNVYFNQDDFPRAAHEYLAAADLMTALIARDPDNGLWLRDLSVSHSKLGDVLAAQKDLAGALVEHRAELSLTERLVRTDPDNLTWRHDRAVAHSRVGSVLLKKGEPTAVVEFRAYLADMQELVAKDPNNLDFLRGLSVSHSQLGELLLGQHDWAGARREYEADLAIAITLAAKDPDNMVALRDLSVSHSRLGGAYLERHEFAAALVEFKADLAIASRLASVDPGDLEGQRDLAASQETVAQTLLAMKSYPAALEASRAALALRERAVQAHGDNVVWQQDLAVTRQLVGDVLLAQRDEAGARLEYQQALDLLAPLAAGEPAGGELHLAQRTLRVRLARISAARSR